MLTIITYNAQNGLTPNDLDQLWQLAGRGPTVLCIQEPWRSRSVPAVLAWIAAHDGHWQGHDAGGACIALLGCTPSAWEFSPGKDYWLTVRVQSCTICSLYARPAPAEEADTAISIAAALLQRPGHVIVAGDWNGDADDVAGVEGRRHAALLTQCPHVTDAWQLPGSQYHAGDTGLPRGVSHWRANPPFANRKDAVYMTPGVPVDAVHAYAPDTVTRSDHGPIVVRLHSDSDSPTPLVRSPSARIAAREKGRTAHRDAPTTPAKLELRCAGSLTRAVRVWLGPRCTLRNRGLTRWTAHLPPTGPGHAPPPAERGAEPPDEVLEWHWRTGWQGEKHRQRQRMSPHTAQKLTDEAVSAVQRWQVLRAVLHIDTQWRPVRRPTPPPPSEHQCLIAEASRTLTAYRAIAAGTAPEWTRTERYLLRKLPRSDPVVQLLAQVSAARAEAQAQSTAIQCAMGRLALHRHQQTSAKYRARLRHDARYRPGRALDTLLQRSQDAQHLAIAAPSIQDTGAQAVVTEPQTVMDTWVHRLRDDHWVGTRPHQHAPVDWQSEPLHALKLPQEPVWLTQCLAQVPLSAAAKAAWGRILVPPSDTEWRQALRGTSTSPGPDGLTRAAIRHALPEVQLACRHIVADMLAGEDVPELQRAELLMLPKRAAEHGCTLTSVITPEAARPLRLQTVLVKLATGVVATRLAALVTDHALVAPTASGFLPDRSAKLPMLLRTVLRERAKAEGTDLVTLEADIAKAYDSVTEATVRATLHRIGAPDSVCRRITNWMQRAQDRLRTPWGPSEAFHMAGLPQGDPLSPVLFVIALDPWLAHAAKHHPQVLPSCYADDVALASTHAEPARHATVSLNTYTKYVLTANLAQHKCVLRHEGAEDVTTNTLEAWPCLGAAEEPLSWTPRGTPSRHLGVLQGDTAAADNLQRIGQRAGEVLVALASSPAPLWAKAWAVRTVGIPRMVWPLACSGITTTRMDELDAQVHAALTRKRFQHVRTYRAATLQAPPQGVAPGADIPPLRDAVAEERIGSAMQVATHLHSVAQGLDQHAQLAWAQPYIVQTRAMQAHVAWAWSRKQTPGSWAHGVQAALDACQCQLHLHEPPHTAPDPAEGDAVLVWVHQHMPPDRWEWRVHAPDGTWHLAHYEPRAATDTDPATWRLKIATGAVAAASDSVDSRLPTLRGRLRSAATLAAMEAEWWRATTRDERGEPYFTPALRREVAATTLNSSLYATDGSAMPADIAGARVVGAAVVTPRRAIAIAMPPQQRLPSWQEPLGAVEPELLALRVVQCLVQAEGTVYSDCTAAMQLATGTARCPAWAGAPVSAKQQQWTMEHVRAHDAQTMLQPHTPWRTVANIVADAAAKHAAMAPQCALGAPPGSTEVVGACLRTSGPVVVPVRVDGSQVWRAAAHTSGIRRTVRRYLAQKRAAVAVAAALGTAMHTNAVTVRAQSTAVRHAKALTPLQCTAFIRRISGCDPRHQPHVLQGALDNSAVRYDELHEELVAAGQGVVAAGAQDGHRHAPALHMRWCVICHPQLVGAAQQTPSPAPLPGATVDTWQHAVTCAPRLPTGDRPPALLPLVLQAAAECWAWSGTLPPYPHILPGDSARGGLSSVVGHSEGGQGGEVTYHAPPATPERTLELAVWAGNMSHTAREHLADMRHVHALPHQHLPPARTAMPQCVLPAMWPRLCGRQPHTAAQQWLSALSGWADISRIQAGNAPVVQYNAHTGEQTAWTIAPALVIARDVARPVPPHTLLVCLSTASVAAGVRLSERSTAMLAPLDAQAELQAAGWTAHQVHPPSHWPLPVWFSSAEVCTTSPGMAQRMAHIPAVSPGSTAATWPTSPTLWCLAMAPGRNDAPRRLRGAASAHESARASVGQRAAQVLEAGTLSAAQRAGDVLQHAPPVAVLTLARVPLWLVRGLTVLGTPPKASASRAWARRVLLRARAWWGHRRAALHAVQRAPRELAFLASGAVQHVVRRRRGPARVTGEAVSALPREVQAALASATTARAGGSWQPWGAAGIAAWMAAAAPAIAAGDQWAWLADVPVQANGPVDTAQQGAQDSEGDAEHAQSTLMSAASAHNDAAQAADMALQTAELPAIPPGYTTARVVDIAAALPHCTHDTPVADIVAGFAAHNAAIAQVAQHAHAQAQCLAAATAPLQALRDPGTPVDSTQTSGQGGASVATDVHNIASAPVAAALAATRAPRRAHTAAQPRRRPRSREEMRRSQGLDGAHARRAAERARQRRALAALRAGRPPASAGAREQATWRRRLQVAGYGHLVHLPAHLWPTLAADMPHGTTARVTDPPATPPERRGVG